MTRRSCSWAGVQVDAARDRTAARCGEERLRRPIPSGRPGAAAPTRTCEHATATRSTPPGAGARGLLPLSSRRGASIIRLPFQWGSVRRAWAAPRRAVPAPPDRRGGGHRPPRGMRAIIDVHSGGRHPDVVKATSTLGDGISQEEFDDLWLRLSDVFRDDGAVRLRPDGTSPTRSPTTCGRAIRRVWCRRCARRRPHAAVDRGQRATFPGRSVAGASAQAVDRRPRFQTAAPSTRPTPIRETFEEPQRETTAADQDEFLHGLRHFVDWLSEFDRRGSIGEVGWPSARRVGAAGAADGTGWATVVRDGRRGAAGRHLLRRQLGVRQLAVGLNPARNGLHLPGLHQAESQAEVIEAHPSSWCAPRCGAPAGAGERHGARRESRGMKRCRRSAHQAGQFCG